MSASPLQTLAVVSINRAQYSETFIQQSFDFFPCAKTLLYGGYLPHMETTDWRVEGKELPSYKPRFWESKPVDATATQVAQLREWLQKVRPDAVLAHYGPSGVAMAPLCSSLGIPLLVHFHGYDAYRADILGSYGMRYATLFQQAAQLIVVSQDMARQLETLGADAAKIRRLVYGANLQVFRPQPLPPLPFRFAYVGRFVPKKAPDQLLRAYAQVHAQLPTSTLVMVGAGELLGECQAIAAELGLGNAVSFLGALPANEVARVLRECQALVLPSRVTADGDSEGTPLVVMEAGATGRAVIATRHAGIPDVIRDGHNGLLVPENDPSALVNAMLQLAQDLPSALEMGRRAAVEIAAHYSQAAYHHSLWQCCENAVANARNS